MKNILIDALKKSGILVCDGAMGTMLQAEGLEASQPPELWNLKRPDVIFKVHKEYIEAGADIIITNTFGANPIKLERAGLKEKVKDINKEAVEIAKKAIADSKKKRDIYILGDIGPTGGLLTPAGLYSYKDFNNAFFEQATILCEAGVDAFIIETMSDTGELEAAFNACKTACEKAGKSLPVIGSMAFSSGRSGYRTMMGVSIEQLVEKFVKNPIFTLGCDVVGANCGTGSQEMVQIMTQMKAAVEAIPSLGKKVFFIAQPNAGMPRLANGRTIFDETPEVFSRSVKKLVELNVNIIGGCCGTTPEHIKAIKNTYKSLGTG
jgi:5-methyltetrahydrofolate--homocysteine methyltransferase